MKNAIFLNSTKVDFDNSLNLKPLMELTNFTKCNVNAFEDILRMVTNQNILITKELPINRELIYQLPSSVELICEAGTGYNNIDLAAAKERNITVCNIPGYSSEAVAQLAITFILNLSSSMAVQQIMLKQKNFTNFTNHLNVPHFELLNKTLGIIGCGSIGNNVIKIARSLGMNILVYTRTQKTWKDSNIRSATLEDLLKNSDFVSIHCPLTPDTKYLINKEKLELMKSSAFIINTSRGAIINETDLIEALQKGIISGAALDVQDPEPPEPSNPMFAMDNVILTPHIGWKCKESRQRLINLLAANIKSFIEGNPINIVN